MATMSAVRMLLRNMSRTSSHQHHAEEEVLLHGFGRDMNQVIAIVIRLNLDARQHPSVFRVVEFRDLCLDGLHGGDGLVA